jgi:hypothetical protein
MRHRDKKRLLEAWLEPGNKRRILKLARRYVRYFRAEPEDLIHMMFEVLWRRPSFGVDDNVFWLAQDAIQNLVKNRRRSQDYKRLRFFPHKTTTPLDDYAENEWIDESGEEFEDENLHATPFPNPEKALLEKERVETYRTFLGELKKTLDPIELAVLEDGEDDSYDTTELQKKLRCSRDRIYEARRSIKARALELRKRWEAGGRLLPGFLAIKKKEEKS